MSGDLPTSCDFRHRPIVATSPVGWRFFPVVILPAKTVTLPEEKYGKTVIFEEKYGKNHVRIHILQHFCMPEMLSLTFIHTATVSLLFMVFFTDENHQLEAHPGAASGAVFWVRHCCAPLTMCILMTQELSTPWLNLFTLCRVLVLCKTLICEICEVCCVSKCGGNPELFHNSHDVKCPSDVVLVYSCNMV